MSKMTIEQTADWLKQHDDFLILTHRRPDGDTIGSASALAFGLRAIGKNAYLHNNPETTARYQPYAYDYLAPEGFQPKTIITVDTASSDMFSYGTDDFHDHIDLCIDHHTSNTSYAKNICLFDKKAACGEIIYEILLALDIKIEESAASALYVALTSDTGCFVYSNTTAGTLEIASKLIQAGARHREINKVLYRTKSMSRIKIEGAILSGLLYYFENTVAISVITLDMMKEASANTDDIDDIAAIPGSVEGVRVGITIREMTSTDDCKVSVRSVSGISSNDIAALFGGGGHSLSAGFSQPRPASEIVRDLIEVLPRFLPYRHKGG